jgi:DNA-binding SARP family transcriptional activator
MVISSLADTYTTGRRIGDTAAVRPGMFVVSVLNGFELRLGKARLTLPRGCQRLVALLALNPRPILRSYVAGTLWTDSSETRAAANLRTAIWRLHCPPSRLVGASGTHVWLAPDVIVDVREASHAALRLLDETVPESGLAADEEEQRLSADVLPDWYDEWVVVAREQFRQLRLHALEKLCEHLISAGRYERAVRVGIVAVAGEPLRESAQRVLVRAHLAEGNPFEALRQYGFFRQLLRAELGVEPSEEMGALVSSLLPRTSSHRSA